MHLGGDTYIRADQARCAVRGGGFGVTAWLARITGPDAEYGIARDFVYKDMAGLSASKKSGAIYWAIDRPGVYEWCKFCVGSTAKNWRSDGFCVIDLDGNVTPILRGQVLEKVAEIDRLIEAAGKAD